MDLAKRRRCRRRGEGRREGSREEGVALVVVAMATTLLLAFGAALILITGSESMIAANFRLGEQASYAADAVLERALSDLRALSDWSQALDGTSLSSFTDGRPSGVRRIAGSSPIDLGQIVNLANCRRTSACSDSDMDAITFDRPWGANNPRWRPYAFGPLADLLGRGGIDSPFYVVAFVADDPSENDGDPDRDGLTLGFPNPGLGVVTVRGEAFGPSGSHKVVEATIERVRTGAAEAPPSGLRVLSWREVR
jgi:hypothetical protein